MRMSHVCRDERCSILAVHGAHVIHDDVRAVTKRYLRLGWVADPLEGRAERHKQRKLREQIGKLRMAWVHQTRRKCLEEIIVETTSPTKIRIFADIYDDVINTYGSITERTIYRYIENLITCGTLVRVTFDRRMSGYLRAPTPSLSDPAYLNDLHEQLDDALQARQATSLDCVM